MVKCLGLFGFGPSLFLRAEETPLLCVYFEICYCNSQLPSNIPHNMYEDDLCLAGGVYRDIYLIVFALSC
jgi:hypothetical protein